MLPLDPPGYHATGWLNRASRLFAVVRTIRAPLLVALAAGLFLLLPPQMREVYRAIAEDLGANIFQLCLSALLLCVVAVTLGLITRELLRDRSASKTSEFACKYLPIFCAGIIPAALSIGLFLAAGDTHIDAAPPETLALMPELDALIQAIDSSTANLVTAGIVCALITLSLVVPNIGFRSLWVRKLIARRKLRIAHLAAFGLIWLVFFSIFPIAGGQIIGPIGILMLAIAGVSAVAALLTRAGDRRGLPILLSVLVVAILLSSFNLSDNHTIDLSDSTTPPLSRVTDVFHDWYESRADREYYASRNKPYPVFIVAASGGGLYAAHHAATVLARLQDRCKNFAQHVFAISAVSGGSLGGALFSSLAKREATNAQHADCVVGSQGGAQFEGRINQFLQTDFLSPLLASALFPDAVQRFLPAFTSHFDRARTFERTLSHAWAKLYPSEKDDLWSRPYLEHWKSDRAAPALILNSTNVEHGYRVAITPFRIIDMGELGNIVSLSNLAEFHRLAELRSGDGSTARLRDTTLATAVSLSARFPWVVPAGRLETQHGALRLVDGGYVENSGVETVFDLVQVLGRFYNDRDPLRGDLPPILIHIIVITNLQILQSEGWLGLNEVLSPVRTMLSTREARAVVAISRMFRFVELCAAYAECGKRVDGASFTLNLYDFDLPLGWLLAPSTRKIVELHSGNADRAGTYLGGNNIDDKTRFERLGAYAANNDTAACRVVALVQADERRCD